MKALLINGSHRKSGNTEILLNVVKQEFEKHDVVAEIVSILDAEISHCTVCEKCKKMSKCNITDGFNPILSKMIDSDILVMGSPVYVGLPSSRILALIQRATYLAFNNDHLLKNKIAAAVVVAGETGHLTAMNSIVDFFLVNEMIVPGSHYWPVGTATEKGDILRDSSAIENLKHLAIKLADLARGRNL